MITSLSNSKIKYIRKLKDKRFRQETGHFYIEGIRIFGEAIQNMAGIQTIIYSPELLESEFCLDLINGFDNQERVMQVSKDVFKSISKKDHPQGIGAVITQSWQDLDQVDHQHMGIVLALDSVQDPGNLGTILRTSDAINVRSIVLLDNSTDPYNLSSIRASMGAVFNHSLIRCKIDEFEEWVNNNNINIVGTSDHAQTDYYGYDYPENMVLLMGSEKQGLQERHFSLCRDVVKIPMEGRSDSLNLAVATSLVLYQIYNQRRCKR